MEINFLFLLFYFLEMELSGCYYCILTYTIFLCVELKTALKKKYDMCLVTYL